MQEISGVQKSPLGLNNPVHRNGLHDKLAISPNTVQDRQEGARAPRGMVLHPNQHIDILISLVESIQLQDDSGSCVPWLG